MPAGFDVVPQIGGGLASRLAAAFEDCFSVEPHEPVVLIGMDTPQVSSTLLRAAEQMLLGGADAVLGPATDGGYWLVGMRAPIRGAFDGVPMSASDTFVHQRRRFDQLGATTGLVATLDDVDTFQDASRVAATSSGGRFRAAVEAVRGESLMARS
jgi:glycosyltransferase A (GT-A) superfamily protein (DUF2064 family)